jgi:hypothetical protein
MAEQQRPVPMRFNKIRIEAVHYPHPERPVELAGLIARFPSASMPEMS